MKQSAHLIAPLFLASYAVLYLFAHNINNIPFEVAIYPLAVSVSMAFIIWSLLFLIVRDGQKAGIAVSIIVLLFFSYGFVRTSLNDLLQTTLQARFAVKAISTMTGLVLFPIWSAAIILFPLLVLMAKRELVVLGKMLTVFATVLISFTLLNIGWHFFTSPEVSRDVQVTMDSKDLTLPEEPPNIFYIVLDGYGRGDVLRDLYGFDNSDMVDYLKKKGFFVAEKSHSNYAQTPLSLSSTLNFMYLDKVAKRVGPKTKNRGPLSWLIRNNLVFSIFKKLGYKIALFESGYATTSIKDKEIVDFYLSPGRVVFSNEFYTALYDSTILSELSRLASLLVKSETDTDKSRPFEILYSSFDGHRRSVLFALQNIGNFAASSEPVFVFSHIISPHPPFLLDESGGDVDPNYNYSLWDGSGLVGKVISRMEYRTSYIKQLRFINKKVMEMVDTILENSVRPPIIILQGDHGPGAQLDWDSLERTNAKERLSILSAYYMPGNKTALLYSSITPVNSFKVIFNTYFGADLKLSEDKSYFSLWDSPYDFIDVSEKL